MAVDITERDEEIETVSCKELFDTFDDLDEGACQSIKDDFIVTEFPGASLLCPKIKISRLHLSFTKKRALRSTNLNLRFKS